MRKTILALLMVALLSWGAGMAIGRSLPYNAAPWIEAVDRGLIEGDASYYYDGRATDDEMFHALMVAILAVDDNHTTVTPPTTVPPTTTTTPPPATTTTTEPPPTTTTTQPAPTTTTTTTEPPPTTTTTQPPSGDTLKITSADSGRTFTGLTIANPGGPCIEIYGASDITIRDSTIGPCGTYPVVNAKAIFALDSSNIHILNNTFIGESRNMVQFDKVQGGTVIGNVGTWPLGESYAEDLVNMFMSNGTAANPILIQGNFFTGGGPSDSGSCIMMGDAGGSYQTADNNVCTNAGQVGIGVASGEHMVVSNNTVTSVVLLWSNVGLSVWNQYPTPCSDVTFSNNTVEWYNSAGLRNDFWDGGGC